MRIDFYGPDSDFFTTALSNWPDDGPNVLAQTSTQIVLQHPNTGAITTVNGSGFSFSNTGSPTGGTITSATFQQNGSTVATFTNISWGLIAFDNALVESDNGNNGPLSALFNQSPLTLDASAATTGFDPQYLDIDLTTNATLIGSNFDDDLGGGNGNDTIDPRESNGFDQVWGSAGNDSIIYTSSLTDYQALLYSDLGTAITVNLNGGTNTMTVNKGALGTDTITDVINPLVSGWTTGGLAVYGSEENDTFNINTPDDTWMAVTGGAGDDTFNLTANGGTIRIDYQWDGNFGPNHGITVDLDNGGVTDDGFGDTDTINATGSTIEIRGTHLSDTFYGGSGDDRFILHQGNDIADGGAGYDTLRYDRSGVEGVTVDLAAGTASGIWRGQAFTDTISNFEEIRGSREAGDHMTGDAGDNTFYGRAGNDTLLGAGGDDRLLGEDGNDSLYGGTGDDRLDGGAGNDYISTGDSTGGDYTYGSSGNDTINFAGSVTGYQIVSYQNMNAGITATVNFATDTGTVNKGANGTDTLQNVLIAGQGDNGGLSIKGTDFNDTFNITQTDATWAWAGLTGGLGNDTYNLTLTDNTVRIDLSEDANSNDATQGANVNLATGTISNDGFGGTDTINATGSGTIEIRGTNLNDTIIGGSGDDRFILLAGTDAVDGGAGTDTVRYDRSGVDAVTVDMATGIATGTWNGVAFTHDLTSIEEIRGSREDGDTAIFDFTEASATITMEGDTTVISSGGNTYRLRGFETFEYAEPVDTPVDITGTDADETLDGGNANDVLRGMGGNDVLNGGDGADTLNGGDGDDIINGGSTSADLRDTVFAGAGNDTIDGGYGNDLIYGQDGDDHIAGGFGSDTLQGQGGNDVITGSALSDKVYGNDGNDFVNGGFGHDRIVGGSGADKFYHLGIKNHGADWVQDYSDTEGDVLVFGTAGATKDDFQINYNNSGSGDAGVDEAFIVYKPRAQLADDTGIVWALVDGGGLDSLIIEVAGGVSFDLLA